MAWNSLDIDDAINRQPAEEPSAEARALAQKLDKLTLQACRKICRQVRQPDYLGIALMIAERRRGGC
jgi:hypothetical protein